MFIFNYINSEKYNQTQKESKNILLFSRDDKEYEYLNLLVLFKRIFIVGNILIDNYHVYTYNDRYHSSECVKIGLFNIYDGYLHSEYGSNDILKHIILTDTKLLNLNSDNDTTYILFKIDSIIYDEGDNSNYLLVIYKLTRFLYLDEYKNAFISFGKKGHSTMMYISKNKETQIFTVTYMNTGEGVDISSKTKNRIHDGDYYYDLFKTIYIPYDHMTEFIYFLKPFIYFKIHGESPNEPYDIIKYQFLMEEMFINMGLPYLSNNTFEANSFGKFVNPTILPTGNLFNRYNEQRKEEYKKRIEDKTQTTQILEDVEILYKKHIRVVMGQIYGETEKKFEENIKLNTQVYENSSTNYDHDRYNIFQTQNFEAFYLAFIRTIRQELSNFLLSPVAQSQLYPKIISEFIIIFKSLFPHLLNYSYKHGFNTYEKKIIDFNFDFKKELGIDLSGEDLKFDIISEFKNIKVNIKLDDKENELYNGEYYLNKYKFLFQKFIKYYLNNNPIIVGKGKGAAAVDLDADAAAKPKINLDEDIIQEKFNFGRFKNFIHDIKEIKNLEDWYEYMFNLYRNNPLDNYNIINNLFNNFNNIVRVPNIKKDNRHCEQFKREFDRRFNEIEINERIRLNQDEKYNRYKLKFIKSIKFVLDEQNNLYFELQKSGTCVYKSLILSIIYHCVFIKKNIDLLLDFFENLILFGYNQIKNNLLVNIERELNYSSPNTQLIINKLYLDKIIDNEYSTYLNMYMNKIKTFVAPTTESQQKISYSTVKYSILLEIIESMRNAKNIRDDSKEAYKEGLKRVILQNYSERELFSGKLNSDIMQPLYELEVLHVLFEYYFNYDKYTRVNNVEPNTKLDDSIISNLYKFRGLRIKLTELEQKVIILFFHSHEKIDAIYRHITSNVNMKPEDKILADELKINLITEKEILSNYTFHNRNTQLLIYIIPPTADDNTIKVLFNYIVNKEYVIIYTGTTSSPEYFYMLTYIINNLKETISNKNIYITDVRLIEHYVDFIHLYYCYFTSDELKILFILLFKKYILLDGLVIDMKNREYDISYRTVYHMTKMHNRLLLLFNKLDHQYYYIYCSGYSTNKDILKIDDIYKGAPSSVDYINYVTNNDSDMINKNRFVISDFNDIFPKIKDYFETINLTEDNFDPNIFAGILINNSKIFFHNPNIKLIDATNNIYEYLTENKIFTSNFRQYSNNINDFCLINILGKNNLIFVTDGHIIVILLKKNFDNGNFVMEYDTFITFSIIWKHNKSNEYIEFEKDKDGRANIWINNKKAIYTNDIKTYPFLSSAIREAVNFVIQNDVTNEYSYISILNNFEDEQNKDLSYLYQSVIKIGNDETFYNNNYYAEFKIKDNFLTFKPDKYNVEFFNKYTNTKHLNLNNKDFTNKVKKEFNFNTMKKYINFDFAKIFDNNKLFDLIRSAGDITKEIFIEIIQNFVPTDLLYLVEWTKIVETQGKKCKTICDKKIKDDLIIKITDFIQQMIRLRNHIVLNYFNYNIDIDTNNKNLLDFINDNYICLSLLMQVNMIIKNLLKFNRIIKKCNELTCYEIKEINKIFDKYEHNKDLGVVECIFELIFGSSIKAFQWGKYNEMLDGYLSVPKKRKIYQLMMGRGKSSVLTPLLYLKLTLEKKEKVIIVVPEHLKLATNKAFFEYSFYFGIKPTIMTDTEIKNMYLTDLQKREEFKDTIFLIDEFDSMYNPLQSNYNIIESTTKIDISQLEYIFDIVNNFNVNKTLPKKDERDYTINNEIIGILTDNYNIKNVTYGMSNDTKEYSSGADTKLNLYTRYVIPYSKKDSPIKNSKLSSNLLTFILTLLYFYNNTNQRYEFEEKDILFLYATKKPLLKKIFLYFEHIEIKLNKLDNLQELLDLMKMFYMNNKSKKLPPEIMKEYYIHIFLTTFEVSNKIENISFIDIMCMESKWQVGYSGTVNLDLDILKSSAEIPVVVPDVPDVPDVPKQKSIPHIACYEHKISTDTLEKEYVKMAFDESKYYNNIDTPMQLLELIAPNENILYDVLIDNSAFFKDFENIDVAKYLFEKSKKEVIYLLKSDNEVTYTENGQVPYNSNYTYNSGEIMYYYDQRHTIGVDFVQPTLLKGIITIDETSKYTDVAQSIFRMRKINEGHKIDICYVGKNKQKYKSSTDILELILQNEMNFNEQIKPLLYLQYLKYFIRKYTKNYIEDDLAPLYEITTDPTLKIKSIIKNKIKTNIFENKSPEEISSIVTNKIDKKNIQSLLGMFINLTEKQQINVLFNSNMINIEKDNVLEIQILVENQKQKQREIDNIDLQLIMPHKCWSIYNYFKDIDEFIKQKLVFVDLIADKIRILLPISFITLFDSSHFGNLVIIEVEENVYMFENSVNINYYLYKFPIYNKLGTLINSNIFTTNLKLLDIENIFNLSFSCKGVKPQSKYNNVIISFKDLFMIDNDTIQEINNIPEKEFEKLIYVYIILAHFLRLPIEQNFDTLTDATRFDFTTAINNIFSNPTNYIEYITDFYYKIGLNRIHDDNRKIELNTKKYNIVFPYLYRNKFRNMFSRDNNTVIVNYNLYNISQGGFNQGGFNKYQKEYYKKKYLEYKHKYLDLKK